MKGVGSSETGPIVSVLSAVRAVGGGEMRLIRTMWCEQIPNERIASVLLSCTHSFCIPVAARDGRARYGGMSICELGLEGICAFISLF